MGDESPKNKVKFLCSYGGKVLPRPSDGVLKYVGGETRVICIPRDITFSEMMKKVSSGMVDTGEVVLKYQLIPEDLDALVSVRTEEDLKHMIEEHDRHESGGAPLLRTYLFPSKPVLVDNNNNNNNNHHQGGILQVQPPPIVPLIEPYLLEQRYLDAINGIIRTSPRGGAKQQLITSSYSACCSPKSNSPDAHTTVDSPFHPSPHASHQSLVSMHKVHSSPSLSNLNINNNTQLPPPPPPPLHDHSHHHHHTHAYHSSSLSTSPQIGMGGMGRPPPIITTDNFGGGRGFNNYYYSRSHKGGAATAYAYHDDSYGGGGGGCGHVMIERVHSVRSPRKNIWE